MTDLDAIRDRAERAVPGLENIFHKEYEIRPVRASARDVPALLELVQAQQDVLEYKRKKAKEFRDVARAVLVAARDWAHNDNQITLQALVDAVDHAPWTMFDDLGMD